MLMNHATLVAMVVVCCTASAQAASNRVHFANKDIFLNGINVAWVNFSGDLGPSAFNAGQFNAYFATVHANGGNALRIWLHTNGANTPVYDANGYVTGPGTYAIQDLQNLLSLARKNNVGLILCLWSFDMLRTTEISAARIQANLHMLNDTSYTMAYVRNSLVPLVQAVKGDSSIIAWEICNEPNGMTTGSNYYPADPTVSQAAVSRFTNILAGAIHRTDPSALVTTGPGSLQTQTDVAQSATAKIAIQDAVNAMSPADQQRVADGFNRLHRTDLTVEQMKAYLNKTAAYEDTNFYRDDRLIAAGGDSLGTLDFYCFHYYNYGTAPGWLSPFTHPAAHWQLTKPAVLAEFFMQSTDGFAVQNLYPSVYNNGYAGALMWSASDFGATPNNSLNAASDTWAALHFMFMQYRSDVIIRPQTGAIYSFTASQTTIQKTDSVEVRWDVQPGSTITLNGRDVSSTPQAILKFFLLRDSTVTLIATGNIIDSSKVTVTVLPPGRIMAFRIAPLQVGTGESATVSWQVAKGSAVTLNGLIVGVHDSLLVFPESPSSTYTLVAQGDERDTSGGTVSVLPPDQVNRAFGATVTVSSTSGSPAVSNPRNMVDGDPTTLWAAGSATSQWVLLDLGKADDITSIVITWANGRYAKSYTVQMSGDQGLWTPIYSTQKGTGGTDGVETLTGLHGNGRFLKVNLLAEGFLSYQIREITAYGSPATGIPRPVVNTPSSYSLDQNFPNPFNPTTTITYAIPKTGHVVLVVHNVLGQKIQELVNTVMPAGRYVVTFDAARLSSGTYFFTLRAGAAVLTKSMTVIR